ncbi:MAG: DUF3581 family protein, partial [Plesiomonas sp.]
MFLTPFYHSNPEHFYFSREQASDFAKKVA